MERKRPVGGTVIGILHLVFSVLGFCGMVCGGIGLTFMVVGLQNAPPPKAGDPDPSKMFSSLFDAISREAPEFAAVMIGLIVVSIIMTVVMFVAGIALLRVKPMGRKLSLFYAIVSIALAPFSNGYMLARGNAATEKGMLAMQEEMAKQQQQQRPGAPALQPMPANPMGGVVGTIIGLIFGLMYPIAVLIVMMMKNVKRAYSSDPGRDEDDRDPPSDRDDGRWRD